MNQETINLEAIKKIANNVGPVNYIWEKLKSARGDNRYVQHALRARIEEVAEADSHAPVRRKITDPELLSACREFEKLNVARIAFERMIPVFARKRSKRVRSLKKAHRTCIEKMRILHAKILVETGTAGTPEVPDTWNGVIRLDQRCLEGYIELTSFTETMPKLSPEHLRYIANGSHPVLREFERKLGDGSVRFLIDLGRLLLEHPIVAEHVARIWAEPSFAESIAKDPVFTKELRYLSQLRLYYGPEGRYLNMNNEVQ